MKKKMSPPAVAKKPKEKALRAPKVYIGETAAAPGEVVGKVTKPMGPSGEKPNDAKDSKGKSAGGCSTTRTRRRLRTSAWAAKRKAANEAWGSVKPEGKKTRVHVVFVRKGHLEDSRRSVSFFAGFFA